MNRKLVSAALFVTVLGAMLLLPPLANVFQLQRRFFGVQTRQSKTGCGQQAGETAQCAGQFTR